MGLFEIYEAQALRHANQDLRRKRVARKAEPLLSGLLPGKNYVDRPEFKALSRYLLHGLKKQDWDALDKAGRFSIGSIEILANPRAKLEWLTAKQIAKMAGLTERYVQKLLKAASVSFKTEPSTSGGNPRKLYSFLEVRAIRWAKSSSSRPDAA